MSDQLASRKEWFQGLICLFLLAACWVSLGMAEPITYSVAISGEAPTSGHLLQVNGTITVDVTTNELVHHDLSFFHEGNPGIAVLDIPSRTEGAGFVWNATPQELRFERQRGNSFIEWIVITNRDPLEQHWLVLGSGVNAHTMGYVFDVPGDRHLDEIVLKPASGPDAPGFLVGTVAEPSNATWLIVFSIAVIRSRQRARHLPSQAM